MIKVLLIFGTRPEAIKLAPVIRSLRNMPLIFNARVCVTAQHRQILDQVLDLFEIIPDYDLNIMTTDQSLAQVTQKAVEGLSKIIETEGPDVVLVQGDTTTTFCGALAAFYNRVKVGHIEAGLRTSNKYAPFPEEINRRLTTQLTDYHFAPTEFARRSLINEGIKEDSICVTGNTVIDSLMWIQEKIKQKKLSLPDGLEDTLDGRRIVLVTGHRRENFGEGFKNICMAIRDIADRFDDVLFVYPVHLNPNVQEPVNRFLRGHQHIHLVEPLAYAPFVWLMNRATIVLTDSGGVQEEATSLGKPLLVLREATERPEAIEAGNAFLVGTKKETIISHLCDLLVRQHKIEAMAKTNNVYGDGQAAKRIVGILEKKMGDG